MATILSIETSTSVCSASIALDKEVLMEKISYEGNHATHLPVFIKELLDFSNEKNLKIDAVAVSEGPGSYTGLRIGVSSAKGLCYALDISLIAVDTLAAIALEATKHYLEEDACICPMIDARRMEVYTSVFSRNLLPINSKSAKIIDENSFSDMLETSKIVFCGNGSDKCKNVLRGDNAIFLPDIVPLSRNIGEIAFDKFNRKEFENIAYFEPSYLKEFQATTPKNKI